MIFCVVLAFVWYGTGIIQKNKRVEDLKSPARLLPLIALLFVMIIVLHLQMIIAERSGVTDGLKYGIFCALGYGISALGIQGITAGQSLKTSMTDMLFFLIVCMVSGAIIGSWMG